MQSTRRKLLMITTFVGLAMAGQAQAAEPTSGFYVNLGVAGLLFDTDASISAAGRPLPGSNLHASNNVTLGFGIGYFVTPDVSLLALLGVPPTTTLTGQGSLSGITLGKVTYGPSMLTANYHFRQFGAFQPFLGAGLAYTIVFGTQDNAVANLRGQEFDRRRHPGRLRCNVLRPMGSVHECQQGLRLYQRQWQRDDF